MFEQPAWPYFDDPFLEAERLERMDDDRNQQAVNDLLPAARERWADLLRQQEGVGDTTPASDPGRDGPSSRHPVGADTHLDVSVLHAAVLDAMEHPGCWPELHSRCYSLKTELEIGRSPA